MEMLRAERRRCREDSKELKRMERERERSKLEGKVEELI